MRSSIPCIFRPMHCDDIACRAVLHSFVEQPSDIAAVVRLLKTISKPRFFVFSSPILLQPHAAFCTRRHAQSLLQHAHASLPAASASTRRRQLRFHTASHQLQIGRPRCG